VGSFLKSIKKILTAYLFLGYARNVKRLLKMLEFNGEKDLSEMDNITLKAKFIGYRRAGVPIDLYKTHSRNKYRHKRMAGCTEYGYFEGETTCDAWKKVLQYAEKLCEDWCAQLVHIHTAEFGIVRINDGYNYVEWDGTY